MWRGRSAVLLVAVLVAGLAGCSRQTLVTAVVDLRLFFAEDDLADERPVISTDLELPSSSGVSSQELGLPAAAVTNLESLGLELEVELLLSDTVNPVDIELAIHVGVPTAFVPGSAVAAAEVVLAPDVPQTLRLSLRIDDETAAETLALLRSGLARIGLRLSTRGASGTLTYEVTRFDARSSVRLLQAL